MTHSIWRDKTLVHGVDIATSVADSTVIDNRGFASGAVEVPAGSSLTTITFYAVLIKDGTMLQVYDQDHVAVTLTVAASEVCTLPDEVYNLPRFAMKADAAETAAKIFLKS